MLYRESPQEYYITFTEAWSNLQEAGTTAYLLYEIGTEERLWLPVTPQLANPYQSQRPRHRERYLDILYNSWKNYLLMKKNFMLAKLIYNIIM